MRWKLLHEGIWIKITNLEDLWYIELIIEPGDKISGYTYRSYKVGKKEEKKKVFLKIEVEKMEFEEFQSRLRITGKIIEGRPEEYIQKGRYHSFSLGKGDEIIIEKEPNPLVVSLLRDAEKKKEFSFVVLVADEERVKVFEVTEGQIREIEEIWTRSLEEEKKEEIYKKLKEKKPIAVFGPGFEKEKIAKILGIKAFPLYSVENAKRELSTSEELKKLVGEAYEMKAMELEELIRKEIAHGKIAFGEEAVKAFSEGRAELLILQEERIKEKKIRENIAKFGRGSRFFIAKKGTDLWMTVKNLGGVVAFLRW